MSIRSTAKAVIVSNGKILLNRCVDPYNNEYYALPGGGQNQYETLEETLVRECLEETGYLVRPVRFAALAELIFTDPEYLTKYPDYTHRIYHIFLCHLAGEERHPPGEMDSMQTGIEWVDISRLDSVKLLPKPVAENILRIIQTECPLYLGAHEERFNHG